MDGLPALYFWECVLETLSSESAKDRRERDNPSHSHADNCVIESNDHVPPKYLRQADHYSK